MDTFQYVMDKITYSIFEFCWLGLPAAITLGLITLFFVVCVVFAEKYARKSNTFFACKLPLALSLFITYAVSLGILCGLMKILDHEIVFTEILLLSGIINVALLFIYFVIIRFALLPLGIVCVVKHRKPKGIKIKKAKVKKVKPIKEKKTHKKVSAEPLNAIEQNILDIATQFTRGWLKARLQNGESRYDILKNSKTEYIADLSDVLKNSCDKPKNIAEQIYNNYMEEWK